MHITDDLIADFFAGKCSSADEARVLEYLEEYPNALLDYLNDETKVTELDECSMSGMRLPADDMLGAVHTNISYERKRKRNKNIAVLCGIAVVALASSLFLKKTTIEKASKGIALASSAQAVNLIHKVNDSDTTQYFRLPDHSLVTLYKHSCIDYSNGFSNDVRNVKLVKGSADFDVFKNPKKPFIVSTDNIDTKALGTKFKISKTYRTILIQLFEGKVVVWDKKNTETNHYYLTPKKQVEYSIRSGIFALSSFGTTDKIHKRRDLDKIASTLDINTLDNVTLQTTLDKLASKYNITIEYAKKDIQNIQIIADYPSKENIPTFLKNIAQMNNLRLEEKGENYYYLYK